MKPAQAGIQNPEIEFVSRVEARSNTSTVALRVVGGDKKGSLESETTDSSKFIVLPSKQTLKTLFHVLQLQ
jgi:hypothetical protein